MNPMESIGIAWDSIVFHGIQCSIFHLSKRRRGLQGSGGSRNRVAAPLGVAGILMDPPEYITYVKQFPPWGIIPEDNSPPGPPAAPPGC